MKMKRVCTILLCFLLIAGCTSNKPTIIQKEKANNTVTINFLTGSLNKNVLKYMNEIMTDFHKKYPDIDVAYEGYQQNQNTDKKLVDVIEERLKNDEATDVACMDVKNIFDFVDEGKLVDLSDMPFANQMVDIAKKDSKIGRAHV